MPLGYRPLLTVIIGAGLLLGIVFGGGVECGHLTATAPSPVATVSGGTATAGGGGGGGGGGGSNALASQTVGTITTYQGDALSVRAVNGQTQSFATAPNTVITNPAPGTTNDLRPGAFVLISPGPPDATGRTRADSIVLLPPAAASALAPGAGALASATPTRTATPAGAGVAPSP
jgi:hypothetical protein